MTNALFLTLTYPSNDPASSKHQRDLDVLLKRMKRMAPDASAVWKLEYTKKNTPHFHLLVFNLNRWAHENLARSWSEIVASTHPDHRRAGTRVERINNKRHAARYIAKYVGKAQELPEGHKGRCWGKSGPIHLALSPLIHYLISREQLVKLRRACWNLRRSLNRKKVFNRRAQVQSTHRFYLAGQTAIALLQYLRAPPLPT